MPDQVAFPALIKELKVYTTIDLDKEARITLRFRPTDEVVDSLNKLMRGDREVMVAFVESPENNNMNRQDNAQNIPQRRKRQPQGPPQGDTQ